MKAVRTHDLKVKVESYYHNNEKKNRYVKIGSMMENEYGSFILLDKTFNPAGVQEEGASILVSVLKVDNEKNDNDRSDNEKYSETNILKEPSLVDDDIPF
jgi:hypothetical protein